MGLAFVLFVAVSFLAMYHLGYRTGYRNAVEDIEYATKRKIEDLCD